MRTLVIFLLGFVSCVVFLVLLCFLGVLFLRRKHKKEVDANLGLINDAIRAMRKGLHVFWCFLLIYSWKLRFYLRKLSPLVVFFTFVFAGISAVAEGFLKLADWAAISGYAPTLAFPTAQFLARVLSVAEHAIKTFYEKPALLIILLACEILIIWHHVHEHYHRNRERKTVENILDMFHPLNKVCVFLNLADTEFTDLDKRRNAKSEAIETFLRHFSLTMQEILKERGLRDVNVCVMQVEQGTDALIAVFESSNGKDQFSKGFRLLKGQGAAGRSVETKQSIYVPNVKYEHAVSVKEHVNDVLTNVYAEGPAPFKSMICTPIMADAASPQQGTNGEPAPPVPASKVLGVLNFSCRRTGPFTEFDFVVARLGARVLSLMYTQGLH